MLLAIDRLVDEGIKNSGQAISTEERKKEKAKKKEETEVKAEVKKEEKKGRMSKEREYLAELARLRKELVELKTFS